MRTATRILSVVIVAICCMAILVANSFPNSMVPYDIGPSNYPKLAAALIIVLSAIVFATANADERPAPSIFNTKFFMYAGLLLASIVLLKYLGFLLTSILTFIPMMMIMGQKTPWKVAATSVGFSVAIYLIFVKLLGVPLPAGILKGIL